MPYSIEYQPYRLVFKNPATTSRGVLKEKLTYLLKITEGEKVGIGECALFQGLSADDIPQYETQLQWFCQHFRGNIIEMYEELRAFPSIQIGMEQAMQNLAMGAQDQYFPTPFAKGLRGIPINGLIWMGSQAFMKKQLSQKLEEGYNCIKIKIGVNWPSEKKWIKSIRETFPSDLLELRVDANGAFSPHKVEQVLEELALLSIHSIEQPLPAGMPEEMAKICAETPVPIALDEELIGCFKKEEKIKLLQHIHPQYIILKPSLVGGFIGTNEWIAAAENLSIQWWITSALESNIGLNAIAQFTDSLSTQIPQGLGTGGLFTNNFSSSLTIKNSQLWHIA